MKHSKKLFLTTCLMLGALGVHSSFAAPPANVALAPNQVMNVNFNTDLSTFDPQLIAYYNDLVLQRMMNDTLFRMKNTGKFEPSLAESYTISDDGLTWTFKLRDAKWSDGKPITAQDFEYSWRRLTDPKTGSVYQNYLELANVVNAAKVAAGKLPPSALGVLAIDDHTLMVQLDKPVPWFKSMLSMSVLVPLRQDVIEKYGENWVKPEHMVVSGPFKITSYVFKDMLKLEKNPLYWDAKDTTLTALNIDFISELNASYYGFQSGKYLLSTIPPQFLSKVKTEFPNEVVKNAEERVSWLRVNSNKVPDVRARKALSLLVNRQVLTDKILRSGVPTTMLAPNSVLGAQDMQESAWLSQSYSQNQAEAIKLLQEAGYTKEHPLELKFLTSNKDNKLFVAMQNWFKRGSQGLVDLDLDFVEDKVYYDRVNRSDFDLTFSGWTGDYPQVTTFLDIFTCGNPINYAHYCNPTYDKLLDQASYQKDDAARAKLYSQAEQLVRNSYYYIPLVRNEELLLRSTKLGGYNDKIAYHYYNDYYILK